MSIELASMTKALSVYTVTAAAELIGVTPARARMLCQEHDIGQLVTARLRLLDAKALAKLKAVYAGQRSYRKSAEA
jgi:hypothetical protein